jgi:S1-C subfamily serine protease
MQASAGGPVLVQAVVAGGPADQAGVQRGDALVDVAGQPIRSPDDLVTIELGLSAGEQVPVEVSRAGHRVSLTLQAAAS